MQMVSSGMASRLPKTNGGCAKPSLSCMVTHVEQLRDGGMLQLCISSQQWSFQVQELSLARCTCLSMPSTLAEKHEIP